MVMISITSNTSITSISGVVLMSIMTSGSPLPKRRDFRPMRVFLVLFWPRRLQPPRGGGSVMKATLAMPARWQAYRTLPTPS